MMSLRRGELDARTNAGTAGGTATDFMDVPRADSAWIQSTSFPQAAEVGPVPPRA